MSAIVHIKTDWRKYDIAIEVGGVLYSVRAAVFLEIQIRENYGNYEATTTIDVKPTVDGWRCEPEPIPGHLEVLEAKLNAEVRDKDWPV